MINLNPRDCLSNSQIASPAPPPTPPPLQPRRRFPLSPPRFCLRHRPAPPRHISPENIFTFFFIAIPRPRALWAVPFCVFRKTQGKRFLIKNKLGFAARHIKVQSFYLLYIYIYNDMRELLALQHAIELV